MIFVDDALSLFHALDFSGFCLGVAEQSDKDGLIAIVIVPFSEVTNMPVAANLICLLFSATHHCIVETYVEKEQTFAGITKIRMITSNWIF
jgi:hypothetical protein